MALEVKVDSIKEDVIDIKRTLKEHINWEAEKYENIDEIYAKKSRLDKLEDRFESHMNNQLESESWWKKNAFNIGITLIMGVIALLTYLK